MADPPFVCPFCDAISHHPRDADERYCGRCHVFVDDVLGFRDALGACRGHATTPVRTTEHMERCQACGTEVRWDLANHHIFGFRAGCVWGGVDG